MTPHTLSPAPMLCHPPFDAALLQVSDWLTEARHAEETGHPARARNLYHAAERAAAQSGYGELLCLVWSWQPGATRA